jgi:hypothetical protein
MLLKSPKHFPFDHAKPIKTTRKFLQVIALFSSDVYAELKGTSQLFHIHFLMPTLFNS